MTAMTAWPHRRSASLSRLPPAVQICRPDTAGQSKSVPFLPGGTVEDGDAEAAQAAPEWHLPGARDQIIGRRVNGCSRERHNYAGEDCGGKVSNFHDDLLWTSQNPYGFGQDPKRAALGHSRGGAAIANSGNCSGSQNDQQATGT
ncbi:hypothetical protein [Arthrobacter mobilis]|uniref:Uncharacterized protein n=1 Tax=Arthrobacter mobilis TaxID=2724944 RepID=A0A7X6HEN9_9MICC|nr:hypothetical protein [Arthrobacter mobilis]NKX55782.1 hypothetical protein [Arthrobacter mobilis]